MQLPGSPRHRSVVLRWMAGHFDTGRIYPEREVRRILLELCDEALSLCVFGSPDAFGFLLCGTDDLGGTLLSVLDDAVLIHLEAGLLGVDTSFLLEGGGTIAGFGLDLPCLLSCPAEHPILCVEHCNHGAVDGLAFRRTSLLCFELGLLKTGLRVLCPPLEFAEVRLEFAQELLDLTLVVALAARSKLACVDR